MHAVLQLWHIWMHFLWRQRRPQTVSLRAGAVAPLVGTDDSPLASHPHLILSLVVVAERNLQQLVWAPAAVAGVTLTGFPDDTPLA